MSCLCVWGVWGGVFSFFDCASERTGRIAALFLRSLTFSDLYGISGVNRYASMHDQGGSCAFDGVDAAASFVLIAYRHYRLGQFSR